MSTILRSGKFVRCFSNATRAILNSPKGYDSNLFQSSRSALAGLTQTWSQAFASQRSESIEPLLQRLDADVRRHGRLSRRDLDEVLEEIRLRQSVSSSQSLLVIRCCGDLVPEELPAERTKLVNQIWKTLKERGVPMDISHYNALLRVYIENEHDFSPSNFLKELEEKGLQPNRVTYQRLMWRYCQSGDVEGASGILEQMRAAQLPLSVAVLDALVLGHVRQGDAAGAQAVLSAMAGAGLQPAPSTYSLLAGGLLARGQAQEAQKVIQDCNKKEIYLSDKDYMDMIEECAINNQEQHIGYLLEQMQRGAGYNQDAVSLILKLITRRREQAALQVLRSMARPASPLSDNFPEKSIYQGAFFIKQLVKTDCPIETTLKVCQQIQDEGLSAKPHYIAIDAALNSGKVDLAIALLQVVKSSGAPIRQHYFWPLFATKGKARDTQGVINILSMMTSEFQLNPSGETLRDYVVPNLNIKDPNKVIDVLRTAGVYPASASRTVIFHLLAEGKIQQAAEVATTFGTRLNLSLNQRNLNNSLIKTDNVDAYVSIVHLACTPDRRNTSTQEDQSEETEAAANVPEHREQVGRLLLGLVQEKLTPSFTQVLSQLHSKGIGISHQYAERIQDKLGASLTPEMSDFLTKLTSGDLQPALVETSSIPSVRRDPRQLEGIIEKMESAGENTLGVKKNLLMAYIRTKQMDKLEEFLKKLNEEDFILGPGITALLMDLYVQQSNLDQALYYRNILLTRDPDFQVDKYKTARLAELYVRKDQYDNALKLVQETPVVGNDKETNFSSNSSFWRLLNTLAEKEPAKTQQMFDVLLEKEFIQVNNVILGPLVKCFLVSNDTAGALDKFASCCERFRCTPWKSELTRRLIAEEDAAGLQRLTDLSTSVHGEVNSLYDLVFGFVECGRLRQARRILETPGLRIRNQRLNDACERYGSEGMVDCLEGLLEATRELSHIDRSEVFQQLLNTYIKAEDAGKALGLWTLLQEESVTPTDKFLIQLATFLKSKNIDVPFVVPASKSKVEKVVERPQPRVYESRPRRKSAFSEIDALIKDNNMAEAKNNVFKSLKDGVFPPQRLMKFFLSNVAKQGDIATINEIGNMLTAEQRDLVLFNNRLGSAYLAAGKSNEFLDQLKIMLDQTKDEDVQQLSRRTPKGILLSVLETAPETLSKFKAIAESFSQRGCSIPMNMLWMHHIIQGQASDAQDIWDKHLKDEPMVFFKKVLTVAYETKNPEISSNLLSYMKTHKLVTKNSIGSVYSNHLEILIDSGKTEDALKNLKEAVSRELVPESLHRSTLSKLKTLVEQRGEVFPYTIPERNTRGDTKQSEGEM